MAGNGLEEGWEPGGWLEIRPSEVTVGQWLRWLGTGASCPPSFPLLTLQILGREAQNSAGHAPNAVPALLRAPSPGAG